MAVSSSLSSVYNPCKTYSTKLSELGPSYKREQILFVFLGMDYPTRCNYVQFYSFACIFHDFIFFTDEQYYTVYIVHIFLV